MKNRIFLLVLNFIQFCFSLHTNLTNINNEYPSCPISFFRGKRALSEYTRWRANQATKQEFIVKVDDDVLNPTTTATNQILAINIQPATKAAEKIIIGGVIVPTVKPVHTTEILLEYTRFVPPTTVGVTQVDNGLYLAPANPAAAQSVKGHPMYRPPFPILAAKHPLRDESPPASPQFIARTPTLLARQYAPITPVAFFPRAVAPPLTPPTIEQPIVRKTKLHPSRTSILPDIEAPTRTEIDTEILDIFKPVVEEGKIPLDLLLTSLENDGKQIGSRRPTSEDFFTSVPVTQKTTSSRNEWNEVDEVLLTKEKSTTNPDSAYNIMYYNEDDNENTTPKKVYQESPRRSNVVIENMRNDSEDTNNIEVSENQNSVDKVTSFDILHSEDVTEENISLKNLSDESIIHTITTSLVEEVPLPFRDKRRPVCNLLKLRELNFNSPRTLPEIVVQLKRWTDDSPIAKWIDITDDNYTTMENPIYMMIIDDPSSGQSISAKQTVLIVAGIQGRDHHAVSAAMYVLYQLIERSEAHADLLTRYRFWIIPVFNPDGYDYSMTFPQRREWMKNLHQSWETCKGRESCRACETHGLRCTAQPCYGVNLDRNFEYQWIPTEELRAEHPCGELYAGARQLSEHETRAITHFLHEQRTPLHTFIAFKEGDVLGVMYPHSHTRKRRAFDSVYRQRASRAASAAFSISGRPYVAGQTSEFLPLYAGGIEDWIDGHLGIDNTYTIMMFRPADSYNFKLITERVVHEAYAAMDTLLLQSAEPSKPQQMKQVSGSAAATTATALLVIHTSLTILSR